MGKVKEAISALHYSLKDDMNLDNASNLSHRRTSANDTLMMDLERELFSPISFPEGAGFSYKDEEYIEDLTPESILETPPIDLPTVDLTMMPYAPEMNCLSFTNDMSLTPPPTSTATTIFHPPHAYPPTPISTVIPQQPFNFQNSPLSPLSSGGYIFNQGNTNLPPQTPFVTPFVPSTTGSAPFTQTVTPVSSEIACRQEKLDKFRQKRTKRNYNRVDKPVKRNLARDENGQFAAKLPKDASPKSDLRVVTNELQKSQMESQALKSKLHAMEQEMALLKRRAELAQHSQEVAAHELAQQQRVNNSLLLENRLLWSSVPSNEVFCTIKQNGSRPYLNVKPFEQKIDFSNAVQELINTDSRILEAARAEETHYEKRWEASDLTPSGLC